MSLKFKIAKRVLTLGKRRGQTAYYAIQEEHPHTTWAEVEERISQSRHCGPARHRVTGDPCRSLC